MNERRKVVFGGSPDQNKERELDQSAREILAVYYDKRLSKFLAGVELDALKDILATEIGRSGGNGSDINFLTAEQITGNRNIAYSNNDPELAQYTRQTYAGLLPPKLHSLPAAYLAAQNIISIDWDLNKGAAEEVGIPIEYLLTRNLCEEEIHAAAKVECHFEGSRAKRIRSGFADENVQEGKMSFELFDEGVVRQLRDEVLPRFCNAVRLFNPADMRTFEDKFNSSGIVIGAGERELLDVFVNRLADVMGLQSMFVWEAIKGAYWSGNEMHRGELREFLNAELGVKYMKRLSQGKLPTRASDLIDSMRKWIK